MSDLSNVKVGDEVVIQRNCPLGELRIVKVTGVGAKFITADGTRFGRDGYNHSDRRMSVIRPVDPDPMSSQQVRLRRCQFGRAAAELNRVLNVFERTQTSPSPDSIAMIAALLKRLSTEMPQ